MSESHILSEPEILYFGTPVVLISTMNEDGTANIAPISSAFWLGWRCVIGIGAASKTTANLNRTGECVLNLPSKDEVGAVDRIAGRLARIPFRRPNKRGDMSSSRTNSDARNSRRSNR